MLLQPTSSGIYCAAGDFYIDPVRPVSKAVITHAHTDHARGGMGSYLTATTGEALVRSRVGQRSSIETIDYGECMKIGDVQVCLHPAGHILGSAQVRVEYNGEVWVVSGDYKLEADTTCEPFEPVKCDTFITESTFGKPTYKWKPQREIFNRINDWWALNRVWGRASLIGAYSLGKAQRVLAGIDPTIGPIYVYPTVEKYLHLYQKQGILFPEVRVLHPSNLQIVLDEQPLIIAPPNVRNLFENIRPDRLATSFASGWMSRGGRNSAIYDIGFPLSDHADWNGLLQAVKETSAEKVFVMHGFTRTLSSHLCTLGLDAQVWEE